MIRQLCCGAALAVLLVPVPRLAVAEQAVKTPSGIAYLSGGVGKSLASIRSDGPWLLLKLPAGRYSVSATFVGRTVEQALAAPKSGPRVVHLRWDEARGRAPPGTPGGSGA